MGSYVDYKAKAGRYSLLRVGGALHAIFLTIKLVMYVTVLAIVSSPSHCYFFGGVGWGWLRGKYSKTFQGMDYSRFPEAGEQF